MASTEPKPDADKKKNNRDIGMLEEDDEFEEFPVEGKSTALILRYVIIDFVLSFRDN